MSRSYQKTPYSGERKNTFMKKQYNRRLRRKKLKELYDNGGSYRKMYERWDICDYCRFAFDKERLVQKALVDLETYEHLKKRFPQEPTRKLAEYLYRRWYLCK